jgi:hypothetical protein
VTSRHATPRRDPWHTWGPVVIILAGLAVALSWVL